MTLPLKWYGSWFLNHFYITHNTHKSGEEFFLLQTKLQVPASTEASQVSPLTWGIAGLRFKIACHMGFYKVFGIYSQKSVFKCVFNQIMLSTLPIYSFVDNILNLLCKISPFHFSFSWTELWNRAINILHDRVLACLTQQTFPNGLWIFGKQNIHTNGSICNLLWSPAPYGSS